MKPGLATALSLCAATTLAGPPDPPFLSVNFSTDELVSIDAATGAVTPIGPLGVNVAIGMTMTRFNGDLYLMDAGFGPLPPSLYTIDETTGAATLVAPLSFPGRTIDFAEAIASDATGLLTVIDDEPGNSSRSKQIARLDETTGVLTALGRLSAGLPGDDGDLDAVEFDPATGDLVGVDGAPLEDVNYYRRADPATGAATEIGNFTELELDGLVNGLHLEGARLFAVTSGLGASLGSIVEVDNSGGSVTVVSVTPLVGTGGSYNGLVRASGCPADVNGDGLATPADFTAWLACFNDPMSAPFCANADVNNDGSISPADFTAWLASFNAGCP